MSTAAVSTPLPPAELINLVSGQVAPEAWGQSRRQAVSGVILPELERAGIELRSGAQILDFGCGCGRLLAGWEGLLPEGSALYGVDINPKLVKFCQENIPFASVAVSSYEPPSRFEAAQLDLVYCSSVFTHMTLPACLRWSAELARIIRPGGTLMLSFHGDQYAETLRGLSPNAERLLARDGYYMHLHGEARATFLGSNDYAAFMTMEFVEALFSGFSLVTTRMVGQCGPSAFAAAQDIAVFRRKH